MKIDCILDRFSFDCFAPEATLTPIALDGHPSDDVDMLFVESTWESVEGGWALCYEHHRAELMALLSEYRKRSIPTVFWAKEDPVFFDQYAWATPLFDYVCTTDSDSVSRHATHVGHNRVFVLPFAAQPDLHFADPKVKRRNVPCFAGVYYPDIFPERREEMQYILEPAIPFGLHLYDRMRKGEQTFPDMYNDVIRPRVPYNEMGKLYREYAVFLNIGSVRTSPTMFSRRVFEILASGTPLVSAYSVGIDVLFGNIVHFSRTPEETSTHIQALLSDTAHWSKTSLDGQKAVLRKHTYAHRLDMIATHCNLHVSDSTKKRIDLFEKAVDANTQEDLTMSVRSVIEGVC